jgi:hypothetical protein
VPAWTIPWPQTAAAPAPETDPYFSDVILLLHADNETGTWVDSSSYAHTPSSVAASSLSFDAATKRFGSSSLYQTSDGSADYGIRYNTKTTQPEFHFGTSLFTIEWHMYELPYATAMAQQGMLCGVYGGATQNSYAALINKAANAYTQFVFAYSTTSSNLFSPNLGLPPVTPDTWHHYAIVRTGSTTLKFFVDGTQYGSDVTLSGSTIYTGSTRRFTVGAFSSNGSTFTSGGLFGRNVDDLRITLRARYTSDFTPPTAAFPNS